MKKGRSEGLGILNPMVGADNSVQNGGKRYFALLSSDDDSVFLRKALHSLLEWVNDTVTEIFSAGIRKYAEKILERSSERSNKGKKDAQDTISELISGVQRAKRFQHSCPLADYHRTMFSFQQEFHSSYRARKGKVLEQILRKFCQEMGYIVPGKGKWQLIAESLKVKVQNLVSGKRAPDIDLVAKSEKCLLVIQIRSRDDTGGTTAKGSLAKALLPIVDTKIEISPETDIIYLVVIWEPRGEKQFSSLVEELASRLKDTISLPSDMNYIKETVRSGKGLEVREKVFLRIAYGVEDIEKLISELKIEEETNKQSVKLSDIERLLEKPDDLWLTYAVVSLELNQLLTKSKTNIDYLKNKVESEDRNVSEDNIDELAKDLHSTWEDTALPFEQPTHNYLYIRDMLYLYLIYQQRRSQTGKRRKKPSKETQSQQQFPSMEGL
jgi:hypothetical protein